MKKQVIGSILCISIFVLGGCGNTQESTFETEQTQNAQEEVTDLCAYVKEIKGNTIVVDPVEYISSEDSDKILTYKHIDDDMPDGYYLYNEDEATTEYTLTDQTEYSFLDWGRDFGGTDEDIRVVTKDKSVFQKYMQTYTDGKPGMPFFFELDGDKVVKIVEKAMA